jgi:hypothetical protein
MAGKSRPAAQPGDQGYSDEDLALDQAIQRGEA